MVPRFDSGLRWADNNNPLPDDPLWNGDPAQILSGASQRIYFDTGASVWRLVIEATMFVTNAVVNVWTGVKAGGTDPVGIYLRESGCDPLAALTVEAA